MKFARFATVISLLASVGCIRKNANITIKIHAKSAEGEDINSAQVSLDRQPLGETNAFGTFTYTFEGEQESIHRIDVVKESDSYYFAPHFETIKLPKAPAGEWTVDATMYMVPKPRPTKSNLSQEISPDAGVKTGNVRESDPVAPVVTDLGSLRDYPFVDEESQSKVHTTLDLSALGSVELDGSTVEASPLFTVHTFIGREPLANAEVYSCRPGHLPALLCKSNDRGRCVVRSATDPTESIWSLIVKHPTVKTQVASGPFERNGNVRFSLMAGQSQDFLLVFDDIGARKPAVNVSTVLSGETTVLTSSACGVVSYVTDKRLGEKTHIRMTHKSLKGGLQEIDHELTAAPFQELAVKPAKRQLPSFVIEPLLPGASLTGDDLNRWFDLAQSSRLIQETVSNIKANNSGVDALRLEEFQNLTRSTPRSIEVVERVIPAWNDRSNALAVASHRLRSVLYRTGDALSLSVQVFDAKANLVYAITRPIATPNDISMALSGAVRSFVDANSHDVKSEVSGAAGPIGKWIIGSMPTANPNIPMAVDSSNTYLAKGPSGSLDIEWKLPPAAVLTINYEPVRFEDDAIAKITDEASHLTPEALLNLVQSVRKDHPQRRRLNLITAFLESVIKDASATHLTELATTNSDHGSIAERMNQAIALELIADRESLAKEERVKAAINAVQNFDALLKDLAHADNATTSLRQIALFYRGQVKAIAGELKNDQMMTMDAEADLREFMKRDDAQKTSIPANEQRLRVAAARALKSLNAGIQ